MKLKHILTIFGVAFVIIGFIGYTLTSITTQDATNTISINGTVLTVELAITPEELSQGLSGRTQLEEGKAMLFDLRHRYSKESTPSFWMKDMLFDLDMIWIANEEIMYIHKNVPAPEKDQVELPRYSPDLPVEYVLEVPAGWSDTHGVQIGDIVEFSF